MKRTLYKNLWQWSCLILLLAVLPLRAQQLISGKVSDEHGETLPYVSIYIEGTVLGTASNSEGAYSIEIKEGQTLVYQCIGYEKKKITPTAQQHRLDVVMNEQVLRIPEVQLVAGKRDPAYEIIEQSIDKRKYYLNQVRSYSGDLYIKGVASLMRCRRKSPFLFLKTTCRILLISVSSTYRSLLPNSITKSPTILKKK